MERDDLAWKIGTMGFAYTAWRGVFFPPSVKQGEQLSYYASRFDAVELDTTFHAMPTVERVRHWAGQVDDDFRFAVKAPKQVTHETMPDERVELMQSFLDVVSAFEQKLGAVLMQFSPMFDSSSAPAMIRFLDRLQSGIPLAVEFRHPSWRTSGIDQLLRERGICLVANDYFDRTQPIIPTANFLYLRFIGEHNRFPKMNQEELDTDDRLAWWADQIHAAAPRGATVWAMFNNDYAGYSPATAERLKRRVGVSTAVRALHPSRSLFD
jgi:uncharacterized protein YecE (DUF72 family)